MFRSLARMCYRRRRAVLGGWIVVLVALVALGQTAGGAFRTDFSLPGSESQQAFDLLREHGFAQRTGEQGQIVFQAEQGVTDPNVQQTMKHLFDRIESDVPAVSVGSSYAEGGQRQISADGTIAYAELNFSERSEEEYGEAGEQIKQMRDAVDASGLQIELGGNMFISESESSPELVGLLGAMVILLIAFGSVLAMGLPILTALFGIGCGVMLVMLGANVITMPEFTLGSAMMIGIGVGIDYALFIVTRYRQALRDGNDPEEATVLAIDTSGRAVLFAGTTVIIAVLGLLVMNLASINGTAIAIAAGVLMTMLASLTLLPAMLGFIRERIDRLGLPHRRRSEERGVASFWHRWSRIIQRRPWPALVVSAGILILLALPVLDLRLGLGDASNRPTTDTTRQAYELLSDGFGPGFNGPLLLAAELPQGQQDLTAMQDLTDELRTAPGIAAVSPPVPSESGDAAIIQLYPTTSPQDQETADLVHRLRNDLLPQAMDGTGVEVLVSGTTAAGIDFVDYTASRMPYLFAIVLGLSFLLLMAVFRSVLVPLKAVIMNLLSIGAAYGVLVAIFQWGWAGDLVGIGQAGPIEAWAPMMIFAVVFGLSMDYEVFLLSRMREEYDRTGDNATSVADGLAATARVISAAAAIMVFVFAAFALTPARELKLLGFGLGIAVFLDATIVRLVLVPSAMELLGSRNWWMPRWLDRLLPSLNVEPPQAPTDAREQSGITAASARYQGNVDG